MFRLIIFLLIFLSIVNAEENTIFVSQKNLYEHVEFLTSTPKARSFINYASLAMAADYIDSVFKKYSSRVEHQVFPARDIEYKNLICSFGPEEGKRIIIGAHYDVCGEQPGADDNASAVSGLLEIARLLHELQPNLIHRVDLAAYTLEEPPFFGTDKMGSAVHASFLKQNNIEVEIMICLEMIGYFTDEPESQKFPIGFLGWFYPDKGNFIAVVSNFSSSSKAGKIKELISGNSSIPVSKLTAPSFLTGVDFSDHRNFWKRGYDAVMITDTAFFRNPNYHQESDTIETLDFPKMAEVVKGVYAALIHFAGE